MRSFPHNMWKIKSVLLPLKFTSVDRVSHLHSASSPLPSSRIGLWQLGSHAPLLARTSVRCINDNFLCEFNLKHTLTVLWCFLENKRIAFDHWPSKVFIFFWIWKLFVVPDVHARKDKQTITDHIHVDEVLLVLVFNLVTRLIQGLYRSRSLSE